MTVLILLAYHIDKSIFKKKIPVDHVFVLCQIGIDGL